VYPAGGAQQAAVSGPILGYVFDDNVGKLRPVRGIPGRATIGPPIDLAMSPVLPLDARHIIASSEHSLSVLDLAADPVASLALPEIPGNPSKATASTQATAAAFYYKDLSEVIIVAGLPTEPRVYRHAGLSNLAGPLTHMAVSNDGTLLVFSLRESEGEIVIRWTASSDLVPFLTRTAAVGGLGITESKTAVVADRELNEIVIFQDAERAAARQLLADARDGVSTPVGVAVSPGNQIHIVNAGSGTVHTFNANGRMTGSQQCNCSLSGANALRATLFRLTDRIDQPLLLLEVSSTGQNIVFVPPPRD
jgi:hypothetical protein